MQVTTDLETLRTEAFVRVARAAIGAGITRVSPFSASTIAAELGVTAADVWMLYDVYTLYYDETPSPEILIELLEEAGLGVSGGLALYGGLRVVQSLLTTMFKSVPKIGWLLNGAMTGASTFVLGMLWQMFLEESRRVEMGAIVTESRVYAETAVGVSRDAWDGPETSMILTERPDGKQGVYVSKRHYDLVRSTIMDMLRGQDAVRLQQLIDAVTLVSEELDKSARWYVNTVKMDLEAHGVIERVSNKSPQELRVVNAT